MPAGVRAGPETCRNWAIASCCIIRCLIAEQSWEGGFCRQRGLLLCEVPPWAQHRAGVALSHCLFEALGIVSPKFPPFSFLSVFSLPYFFCSLLGKKRRVGALSPLPGVQPDELSCEPHEWGFPHAKERHRLLGEPREQPLCKVLPAARQDAYHPLLCSPRPSAWAVPRGSAAPCSELRSPGQTRLRWPRGSGESGCTPRTCCPPALPIPIPGPLQALLWQPELPSCWFVRAGKSFSVFAETPGGQAGVGTHGVRVPGGLCRTEHAPCSACQAPGLAWGCRHTDLRAQLLRGAGLAASAAGGVFGHFFEGGGAAFIDPCTEVHVRCSE